MRKVRHSSATDGDSVASWVEPSEGVSLSCMCVCVWGTPGYHDNPSGQVGEVRAPALAVARKAVRVPLWHAT